MKTRNRSRTRRATSRRSAECALRRGNGRRRPFARCVFVSDRICGRTNDVGRKPRRRRQHARIGAPQRSRIRRAARTAVAQHEDRFLHRATAFLLHARPLRPATRLDLRRATAATHASRRGRALAPGAGTGRRIPASGRARAGQLDRRQTSLADQHRHHQPPAQSAPPSQQRCNVIGERSGAGETHRAGQCQAGSFVASLSRDGQRLNRHELHFLGSQRGVCVRTASANWRKPSSVAP
jgi:hypothetical protein